MNPAGSDSVSIFKDGRVKPGIYKIKNLFHQNYLDVQNHSRQLCCFPAREIEDGGGLWEIKHLGAGYTVKRVEPGKPDQFCHPMDGVNDGDPVGVGIYPTAWRIEVVDDDVHRGFGYVRIYWGTTKRTWDLSKSTGIMVKFYINNVTDNNIVPWRIWELIPVKIEGASVHSSSPAETGSLGSSSLPPYDLDPSGQSFNQAQHCEYERDGFGTVVTEVTTLIRTTRKRYRVEDA